MTETNVLPDQRVAARARHKPPPNSLRPTDGAAQPAPAHDGGEDKSARMVAVRAALARNQERLDEWRRCRLELPISQVERLQRLIAADERLLRDLTDG